jgi:hypothetical protein
LGDMIFIWPSTEIDLIEMGHEDLTMINQHDLTTIIMGIDSSTILANKHVTYPYLTMINI